MDYRPAKIPCPMCSEKFRPNGKWNVHCWKCRERWQIVKNRVAGVMSKMREGYLPHANAFKCADCGQRAFAWDHRDYADPFYIEPVCRSCNWYRGPARFLKIDEAEQTVKEFSA